MCLRQPDQVRYATIAVEKAVDRNLEVRPLIALQRTRDNRPTLRVAAQVPRNSRERSSSGSDRGKFAICPLPETDKSPGESPRGRSVPCEQPIRACGFRLPARVQPPASRERRRSGSGRRTGGARRPCCQTAAVPGTVLALSISEILGDLGYAALTLADGGRDGVSADPVGGRASACGVPRRAGGLCLRAGARREHAGVPDRRSRPRGGRALRRAAVRRALLAVRSPRSGKARERRTLVRPPWPIVVLAGRCVPGVGNSVALRRGSGRCLGAGTSSSRSSARRCGTRS